MFKFTFSSGTGTFNPFAAKAEEEGRIRHSIAPQTVTRKLPAPPKRPSPPPSISEAPPSRKRPWAPTDTSASAATSQPTLTNGWFDTPSRYLEAASQSHMGGGQDDVGAGPRPAKRRKTLTDTIISTAFSAALIGTAVGMTAYRMWRDRGKPTDEDDPVPMEPPPPYESEQRTDDVPQSKLSNRAPRQPRKPRSVGRRTTRRRMPPAVSPSRSPIRVLSPPRSSFQPEEPGDDADGLEHQIDWMGDKIRSLIEEGQRALGNEVVLMNEDEDNEGGAVDDGMDGWEEEGYLAAGPSSPTFSSNRRQSRRPSQAPNTSASPPSRSGATLPATYTGTPTSPQSKRHRSFTNGKRSQASSASTSPHLNVPSSTRLGGRTPDGTESIKVIYEPAPASSTLSLQRESRFQDEDSRGLAERMENIRKAYRIR